MAWTVPEYTREQVDRAGDFLIAPEEEHFWELDETLTVINNWRSSHSFPLNTFQIGLRRRGKRVDKRCLVAQRIKRLSSIESKLDRLRWLKLSGMQDIGGCRAIVRSTGQVKRLVADYKSSELKHSLYKENDYIENPKISGYRGVHLIYEYYSDRKSTYNDLKIEIQLRSRLQHAWATAVETVGMFSHQALKASRGQQEWLRFFALLSTAFAMRERMPIVPGTPENRTELRKELKELAIELDVEGRLNAYRLALNVPSLAGMPGDTYYYLLVLDAPGENITVRGYRKRDLQQASKDYLEIEREISKNTGVDAVLVSADSITTLRSTYPNYFLDTQIFIQAMRRALRR